MTDNTSKFALLHARFNALTDRCMVMNSGDMFRWEVWCSHGWTEDDLCLVVAFINRRIKAQRRWSESLRLHNLIDPARFADDLKDARGEARIPAVTPRDKALVASGRPKPERENVRTPAQVLAAAEAFAAFKIWKAENL